MSKLTNEQKFKTADERIKACMEFLETHKEYDKVPYIEAAFRWLALEADEEKPEPCPFCGVHSRICNTNGTMFFIECSNVKCGYRSASETTKEYAIAAHNRVARAVRAAREGEVK